MFAAVGLDTMPHGASELTAKQLRFALAYLDCGNATQAAREVGYSENNTGKLLKGNGLSRFLTLAVKPVAQNGDQLVRRKWELSVSLHHELMELRGKAKKEASEMKRERSLVRMSNQTDMLLAALLNRLGIKLTAEVTHTHKASGGDFLVLPPDSLSGFARARQEAVASVAGRMSGGAN